MNNFPSSCTSNSQFSTSSLRSCVVSDNKKDVKTIRKGNSGNNNNSSSAKRSSSNKGVMKLSTDPQSVAARERRHRISDRFKILQSLVPGGAKMDTVSMLEEAIHYVKFLKTQIWLHQTMINCQFVDDQEYYYSLQDGPNPPTMFLTPPDHHDHQTTLDHDSANNNAVLEHHHQQHQLPEMPMVPDNYCFDHDHHHQHQGHETTLFGHANYVRYN